MFSIIYPYRDKVLYANSNLTYKKLLKLYGKKL